MSTVLSFKADWREYFERESHYYRDYESLFPIYKNWERMSTAETVPVDLLSDALKSLYSSAPRELSEKFLNWVIEVVDRALADGKLHKTTAHSSFPENRGRALRCRAYAKALLMEQLAVADAQQALEDLMVNIEQLEGLVQEENHVWLDMEETKVLAPSRLALILGDFDRFDKLLPYPRKFKWHKVEADLLLDVADAARQGQPPSQKLTERFLCYFDEVRDPKAAKKKKMYRESSLVRFEIGVLYCKYIDTSEPFTWQRVITEIAR